MSNDPTSWQRIEQAVCWAGQNTASFAALVGLSSPQVFYQIKAGKNGVSRELAERIVDRFPELSATWLLTGEGTMLRPLQKPIPFYASDCTSLVRLARLPEADSQLLLPDTNDCTFAARTFSSALAPQIPCGAIVVLCREEVCNIVAGGFYLVSDGRVALLRRVESVEQNLLRLSPAGDDVAPIEIDATLLKAIFRVKYTINYLSL